MSDSHGRITVLVADDHPLYCAALRTTIEEHPLLELVELVADGRAALAAIELHSPDVALLDIKMSGLDGKVVASRVRERELTTRVLFVSEHHNGEVVLEALTSGAAGFLSKTSTGEEICAAVVRVASGESVLASEVGGELAGTLSEHGEGAARLSARELSVLKLIAEGNSSRAIAERLHLAVPTIKTHTQHVFAKLGVSDRASAVAEAMRRGLLD